MPQTELKNRSWVCLVWGDGSFRFLSEPASTKGVRHEGQRPLFAYGSKYNPAWLKLYATQSVHPSRGQYITVEPFMQEMIDQLVDPKVRILANMHTGDCDSNHRIIVRR